MITNLFSIFDPSSFITKSMNWIIIISFLILWYPCTWLNPNNWNFTFKFIYTYLYMEFKALITKKNQIIIILILSIFTIIIYRNFLGLLPYIFNSTRHISITLALALPSWLALNLFGWINRFKIIIAHIVPQSTPSILMPFIVLIESTRNIIRPLTLAVRLSANIIAGHLLITLIGNILTSLNLINLIPIIVPQIILSTLEIAVSLIQAYVFTVLLTLYIKEIPN